MDQQQQDVRAIHRAVTQGRAGQVIRDIRDIYHTMPTTIENVAIERAGGPDVMVHAVGRMHTPTRSLAVVLRAPGSDQLHVMCTGMSCVSFADGRTVPSEPPAPGYLSLKGMANVTWVLAAVPRPAGHFTLHVGDTCTRFGTDVASIAIADMENGPTVHAFALLVGASQYGPNDFLMRAALARGVATAVMGYAVAGAQNACEPYVRTFQQAPPRLISDGRVDPQDNDVIQQHDQ